MSDQPVQPGAQLTQEELERLRPHEGLTAEEFDQLRRDNQPSRLREQENEGEADE